MVVMAEKAEVVVVGNFLCSGWACGYGFSLIGGFCQGFDGAGGVE